MVDASMFVPITSSFLLGVCGGYLVFSGISNFTAWLGGISTWMAILLFIWALSGGVISTAAKDIVIRDNIIVAPPPEPHITISGPTINQRPEGGTFTNGILIEPKDDVFTPQKGHATQYSCPPNEPNDDGTCYPREKSDVK